MKTTFLCILILLGTSMASCFATDVTVYSGVETYWFLNDSLPDNQYQGCEVTTISEVAADYSFGDSLGLHGVDAFDAGFGAYDIDGAGAGGVGKTRLLCKFDISALPDSAIVYDATLYLMSVDLEGWAIGSNADSMGVGLYRITKPWTEGSGTGTAGDSNCDWDSTTSSVAWDIAGGDDIYDDTGIVLGARWNASIDDLALNWNTPSGSDTVTDASSEYDRAGQPFITYTLYKVGGEGANTKERIWEFDITEAVRKWHGGQWDNNGLMIISDDEDDASDKLVAIYGDENTDASDLDTYLYLRPRLRIRCITVSASTTGGSGSQGLGGKSGL